MKFNTSDLIQLLIIASQYGIPAVLEIIKTWKKDDITLEDIHNLLLSVKEPEDF